MIRIPNMLMIGSAGRNVGKTEFACELIKKYAPSEWVIGLKITTIKEADGKCPRGGEGCGVCSSLRGRYMITKERDGPSGKDTVRMLRAGARSVVWLRVLKEHLEEGLTELLKQIPPGACVICESNSARLAAEPGMFLVIREKGSKEAKASCQTVIGHADKIITFQGDGWDVSPEKITFKDGGWSLEKTAATAVILAGGKSRRMGQDKSLLPLNGQPMIGHIAETLESHFDEILIGADDVGKYSFLKRPVIPDQKPDQGPLMGILSCLERSKNDLNFVMACDVPEPDVAFIAEMLSGADGYDIVMPVAENGRYETLFAVYRKSIIPHAKELLAGGKRRMVELFDRVNVKFIEVDETSWQKNLNTQAEYSRYVKNVPHLKEIR